MDEDGKLIDTVALFRERKIEVGLYVSGTHDGKHTHAVIHAIDQDEVSLYPTKKTSGEIKPFQVQSSTFLASWKPVMSPDELKDASPLPVWPLSGPDRDIDVAVAHLKDRFLCDLFLTWRHFDSVQAQIPIMINLRPRKHVVATEDLEAQSVVLVPFSHSVVFAVPPPCTKAHSNVLVSEIVSPKDPTQILQIAPYFSPPTTAAPNGGKLVPFWAIERLDCSKAGTDEVNCELVSYRLATATVLPSLGKFGAEPTQSRSFIPVLMVTKDVAKGTKLAWCDARWVIPPKPQKAVKASKKAVDSMGGVAVAESAVDMCGPEEKRAAA